MVKALAAGTKDTNSKNMNTPKQGFVQKKKDPKFKQTPTGKVSLINGSKNNGNTKQHDSSKRKSDSPQKTPEKNKEQKKKNSSKSDQKPQQSPKAELKKKTDDEDDTDSEEDINEGIELEEEKSMVVDSDGSEGESDDDSDEKNVPNILGASLADESDEDDEDFEEEEENNAQINKGVKMFKGLKSNDKSTDSDKTDADSSGSEVSVDEDEEVDDDDDDDDSEEEVEGEDDDNDDEDEDEDDDDDEESDDDEDDEESDEEEGDESKLGLKALLGNSIADEDDDDDEDFVHTEGNEEDDDMSDEEEDEEEEQNDNGMVESPEKNKKDKENKDDSIKDFKANKKTIFVGNLPKDVKKKSLLKLFKQFGSIEALRLRGIVGKTVNVPKKVAAKTNMLHPRLKSVYAYIRFDSEKSVDAALSMNGKEFEEHYLRVDRACKSDVAPNPKKSVFVGNLNFTIDDNTLRKHFEGCGEIESVRLVRDNKTGIGRGIGYVNFKNEDGAALALELNGTSIANREIRVQPWSEKDKQTKASRGKRSHSAEGKNSGSSKKFKNNAQKAVQNQNKDNTNKKNQKEQKFEGKQPSPQKASPFQGQKVDGHKKKRKNRSDKKKKFLAEKLTAKPKKPAN